METRDIDFHLKQAFSHLETAVNQSIQIVLENANAKKEIGAKWESFLGQFFGYVRDKGKQHRVNLLGWISFPRLGKR